MQLIPNRLKITILYPKQWQNTEKSRILEESHKIDYIRKKDMKARYLLPPSPAHCKPFLWTNS